MIYFAFCVVLWVLSINDCCAVAACIHSSRFLQPHFDAPEEDTVPGDIVSHKLYGRTWWIGQNWVSESGDYEDMVLESELKDVFHDRAEDLVAYAQQLGKKCPKALAGGIAQMAEKTVETLFPEAPLCGGRNHNNNSKVASRNPQSSSGDKENNKNSSNTCGKHNYVETMYEKQETAYYWATDTRRYNSLPCSICNVSIGNLATFDDATGNTTMTKPTAKTPVFVCKQFAIQKSSCRHIICSACWQTGLDALPPSRTCRHRRAAGN